MTQIICGILLVVASVIGFGLGTKTIVDGWWAKWGPKPKDEIKPIAANTAVTNDIKIVRPDSTQPMGLRIDTHKSVRITYPTKVDYEALAYLGNAERPVGEVLTLFLVVHENGHNEYIVTDRGHTYIGRMYVPLTTPTK